MVLMLVEHLFNSLNIKGNSLSLMTQAVWGKFNPTGLALVLGMKTKNLDVFSHYSVFHL